MCNAQCNGSFSAVNVRISFVSFPLVAVAAAAAAAEGLVAVRQCHGINNAFHWLKVLKTVQMVGCTSHPPLTSQCACRLQGAGLLLHQCVAAIERVDTLVT